MTTLYDQHGRRLELASQGHSGGEGTVYRITSDHSRVAKIYHAQRLGEGLHDKLRVMLDHPPDDPSWNASRHRSIAWVDGLIFADSHGRDFRGFTMPYVDVAQFKQAHVYYDASDRLRDFGGAFTWRHLMFAAHNVASAVAAVHAAGHRVGDMRETNLLVSPTALVTMIDCDSFQITDPRTHRVHPTRVATGDYLPPELQGVDFRTQHPDRYHSDLFALAVLVFRFLMLGAHPFQSRGSAVDDAPSTEAKIAKGVFAYAGHRRGAEPPAYAPPFSVLPKSIRDLAVRAFVDGHKHPDARPTAAEWTNALQTEGKRLKKCTGNTNHWYAHGARSCPWCRIAPDPFPGPAVGHQIAIEGAAGQVPERARVEQLRAYARLALSDGAITDPERVHLHKTGGELGLRNAVVDRVVDEESRRATPRPAVAAPPRRPASVREAARHPIRFARDRQIRSASKAAAPVLAACVLAGVLAPVITPIVLALVVVPAIASAGERVSVWRVPLRFLSHAYEELGHAARVFVPLAISGFALSFVPGLQTGWIVRGGGVLATVVVAWLAIARSSSAALRAGRDLIRRSLVGDSGRLRRPAYALCACCVLVAGVTASNVAMWWPLPRP
jgi:hypothetical protein